jgi:hypothetical protein
MKNPIPFESLSILIFALAVFSSAAGADRLANELNGTKSVAYADLKVGTWYNFYFVEGRSPFPTASSRSDLAASKLTIHAAKIVAKSSESEIRITFPELSSEHLAILKARAKDHADTGSATTSGEAFKKWEKSISEWKTVSINLEHVDRITLLP